MQYTKSGKTEIRCEICQHYFVFDRFAPSTTCSLSCESKITAHRHFQELTNHITAQSQILYDVDWDRSQRIAAIGDVHFPYSSYRATLKLFAFLEWFKPTMIIQVGDLFDFFSFGRFPRSHIITPRDEVKQGRQMALNFWKQIAHEHPNAELHQILGNHCDRPTKQLLVKCPELEPFMDTSEMFMFDGVQTHLDSTEELVRHGIAFMHGYKKFGDHVKHNLMPTVCGHSHTGGVTHLNVRDKVIWELNAGYIADPTQTPLKYRPQKWSKWTHGVGAIDQHGPRFVCF